VSASGDLPSRAAIVATAHESIARGSKSFAAASLLFDRKTREFSMGRALAILNGLRGESLRKAS